MFRTALLIALIGFAACDRLKVSAYIESQCPDCINFIKLSVIKTLAISDIDQILDLEFVPYGNAKQQLLPDGSYGFTCQHGAIECHGNLLEACALHNLEGYRLPCDCTRFYQQVSWIACLEDKRKVSSVQFDVDAKTCSASYPGLYDAI
jgi:interferon gamma-inducible protein 30